MAALTNSDYAELRDSVYRFGAGKEELKALGSLPSKAQVLAMFQAQEDHFVSSYSTIKGLIDAQLGVTTTNPLAQKLIAGYLRWKIKKILGG